MTDLLALVPDLPEQSLAPGEVLCAEGDHSGAIWVLVSGTLTVTKTGAVVNRIERPGAVIGEIAVVLGTGNSATVTAETLGPAGLVAVQGLTDVVVPAGGALRFDLDTLGAGSAPVVLRADVELVAERLLSAPVDQPGATITYGIPSTG